MEDGKHEIQVDKIAKLGKQWKLHIFLSTKWQWMISKVKTWSRVVQIVIVSVNVILNLSLKKGSLLCSLFLKDVIEKIKRNPKV